MQTAYGAEKRDQRVHNGGGAVLHGVAAVDDVRHDDVPADEARVTRMGNGEQLNAEQ
jgi:hypothetical protein